VRTCAETAVVALSLQESRRFRQFSVGGRVVFIFVNVEGCSPPCRAIRPVGGLSFHHTIHQSLAFSATHCQFFLQFSRNSLRFIPGKKRALPKKARAETRTPRGALPERSKKQEGPREQDEGRKEGRKQALTHRKRSPACLVAPPSAARSPADRVR
jgi:hypothetical protein